MFLGIGFWSLLVLLACFALIALAKWKYPLTITTGVVSWIVGVVVITALCSYTVIQPASVGIKVTLGHSDSEILTEGPHLLSPWSHIVTVSTGLQGINSGKQDSATSDSQKVTVEAAITYHIAVKDAFAVYSQDPTLNYGNLLVIPSTLDAIKQETSKYAAQDLLAKRDEVSAGILSILRTKLAQYHLTVDAINVTNLQFGDKYEESIEQKAISLQKTQQAQQDLQRVQFETQQKITQANGEAQAISIQSKAIQEAGGAAYLQLQAINRWDGRLPTYMTSGATNPFIGNVK